MFLNKAQIQELCYKGIAHMTKQIFKLHIKINQDESKKKKNGILRENYNNITKLI